MPADRLQAVFDLLQVCEREQRAVDAPKVETVVDAYVIAIDEVRRGEGGRRGTRSIAQLRHDILLDIVTDGLEAGALPDPATTVSRRKGVAVELLPTVPLLSPRDESLGPHDGAPGEPAPTELLERDEPEADCPF